MALQLSPYEQGMLEGKYGEARKLAMEILAQTAKALDAESMVEVVSVQGLSHYGCIFDAGLELMEKFACLGGKCCVPTTQDPSSIPYKLWEAMGYDREYAAKQLRLRDAMNELEEFSTWSCTPYYQGNCPRIRQNVAWAESSAVSYGNSVLGCRTNRTPAGLAVCAALTGRMPKYGLYLPENRKAQIKVTLEAGTLSELDYSTFGLLLGKISGDYIPAIYGIPDSVTNDELKSMGGSAAASGSVALYHAVGITPEALDGDPFANHAPLKEYVVTREMLDETAAAMTTKNPGEVELVVTGCPHASTWEVLQISKMFEGKKVAAGKAFWIFTTLETENILDHMGVAQKLKAAGVTIMAQTCLVISPLVGGYKTVMTDSGKSASLIPSEHGVELIYGSLKDCIKAVTV